MKEKLKNEYETFRDMVLEEYKKGNIVFSSIEGFKVAPLDKFLEQPIEGILYDLNRGEEVILTLIKDQKWVNDYAVAKVIREIKKRLEEKK